MLAPRPRALMTVNAQTLAPIIQAPTIQTSGILKVSSAHLLLTTDITFFASAMHL
jgi:hypothetical protein